MLHVETPARCCHPVGQRASSAPCRSALCPRRQARTAVPTWSRGMTAAGVHARKPSLRTSPGSPALAQAGCLAHAGHPHRQGAAALAASAWCSGGHQQC